MSEASSARYLFELSTGSFRGSPELSELVGCDGRIYSRSEYLSYVVPDDLPLLGRSVNVAIQSASAYEVIYRLRSADHAQRYVKERGSFHHAGQERRAVLLEATIEACETRPDDAGAQSSDAIDALTGLLSRHAFLSKLESLLEDPSSRSGVALVFLDLDRFRLINDTLGHYIGDGILREIACRLSSVLKHDDLIARSGGDEFLIAVRSASGSSDIRSIADGIRSAFVGAFVAGKERHVLTASIGISRFPLDGITVDDLLQGADAALYDAKQYGGGGVSLVTEGARLAAAERFSLELELQDAILNSELVMHYQPLWNFRSGAISGAEALVRWEHPRRGLVMPLEFIPIIEKNGPLMRQFGNWALDSVFSQLQAWQRMGVRTKVWLNVAPTQISDPGFVEEIISRLFECGIPPACIGIELTERTFIDHDDEAISVLEDLRGAGISIALDDFGIEYSSLNCAYRLPIDTIKIDRTFISGILSDQYDKSVVGAIMSIAAELKASITAEGVENIDQYHALREMGCHDFQGFLYAPALEPEEFFEKLQRSRAS